MALYVLGFGIVISMYGGGFATIPAYLRDLFGTAQVGAIHGRLLTAWSAAGVVGPVLVNYIREFQIEHGVSKANAYTVTMYIMAALLLVGFVCNLLVHPIERSLGSVSTVDQDGSSLKTESAMTDNVQPETPADARRRPTRCSWLLAGCGSAYRSPGGLRRRC